MSLLQKLKSLLGIDDREAKSRDVGVTVEHDPEAETRMEGTTAEPAGEEANEQPIAGEARQDAPVVTEDPAEDQFQDEQETPEPTLDDVESSGEVAPISPDEAEVDDEKEEPPDIGESEAESLDVDEPKAELKTEEAESKLETEESESEPAEETPTPDEPELKGEPESDEAEPTPEEESEPVETIKGIGPSYAAQLGEAGVGTVDELAVADAERLADETGLSEKRITNWIEQAKHR